MEFLYLYPKPASVALSCAEDTLWSGGPSDWNNPDAQVILPQVRELVREGRFAEATLLSKGMMGPNPQVNFLEAAAFLSSGHEK